jgi:O-antigen/teichoic acid export membrane protein
MILICGTLLLGPKLSIFNFHFSIFQFVYAQVAAYVLTALLALVVIARKTHLSLLLSPFRSFSLPFMLVILRKSAPFALLVLLMASYNRIDPILLRALASDADAGIYAGAFRLLDALTMVAYLVSVPLLPVFSKLCKEQKDTPLSPFTFHLHDALRLVFWPLMLFAIGAAVLCALFAEPLMGLLYPGRGALYVPAFRVVIFGLVPIAVTYIFGTLLTAGGHLRQLNLFAATSLLLNIVVNLLLIPRFGAAGSAWASLTAQTFMAFAQLLLAIRLFHLPVSTFRFPNISDIKNSIALFKK